MGDVVPAVGVGGAVEEERLVWVEHPARRRPCVAVAAIGYVALAAAALQAFLRTPWMTAAGALIMVGAVAEFLFATRYRLTTTAAERRRLGIVRRLAWTDVRAVRLTDEGATLYREERPGRLSGGLFLPWGTGREAVLSLVDELAANRRRPGAGADDRGG